MAGWHPGFLKALPVPPSVKEGLKEGVAEVLSSALVDYVQATEHIAYLCIPTAHALGTLEPQACFWKGRMIYNHQMCVNQSSKGSLQRQGPAGPHLQPTPVSLLSIHDSFLKLCPPREVLQGGHQPP